MCFADIAGALGGLNGGLPLAGRQVPSCHVPATVHESAASLVRVYGGESHYIVVSAMVEV